MGLVLLLWAINIWRLADFGRLDYAQTMRWVIPGATLVALGLVAGYVALGLVMMR